MPKALHAVLCLALACAWLSGGVATATHSHKITPVGPGLAKFDVSVRPCAQEHRSEELASPCAACAQNGGGDLPEARSAAIGTERSPEAIAVGSERSDLAFESLLGDAQSPRPPPVLAPRV